MANAKSAGNGNFQATSLVGRVALVTGSSRGIGRAIASNWRAAGPRSR